MQHPLPLGRPRALPRARAPFPWRPALLPCPANLSSFPRLLTHTPEPLSTSASSSSSSVKRRGHARKEHLPVTASLSALPPPHAQARAQADTESGSSALPPCSTVFHTLPSTLRLEVLTQAAAPQAHGIQLPPLLFVHGSYHAAWCWAEHWMPYFAAQGFDCYAVSLLAQGASDVPAGPVAGTIQSHAEDVSSVIQGVVGRPPVLVGHSFGGLIVQAYLSLLAHPNQAQGPPLESLAAAVLACSVPPSGNKDLVVRFLLTRPILSIKVTLSLAAKQFMTSTSLCRDTFFSPSMPQEQVKRYQALMAGSCKLPLFNLAKLNASLPVPKPPPSTCPPVFIVGAEHDAVLDIQALQETSDFFSCPYTVVPSIAHDIMLDEPWELAAKTLLSCLLERFNPK